MSAGICGKRLGFDEIFGSASPPSAKRSCCSRYDFAFGPDDNLAFLLRMFPSMDPEVVETILKAHDNKIDDAIKSLHALCIRDVSAGNCENSDIASSPGANHHVPGMEMTPFSLFRIYYTLYDSKATQLVLIFLLIFAEEINIIAFEEKQEISLGINSNTQPAALDGSSWVDAFVQEMTKASNWDDVRVRVTGMLKVFEKNILTNCKAEQEHECSVLKEQLQCLMRENHILKRAVAIQHERNTENDAKLQEVHQLKLMINQYQEQVRTLELNNYTLTVHLQRAQDSSSIPNHFHPDIF